MIRKIFIIFVSVGLALPTMTFASESKGNGGYLRRVETKENYQKKQLEYFEKKISRHKKLRERQIAAYLDRYKNQLPTMKKRYQKNVYELSRKSYKPVEAKRKFHEDRMTKFFRKYRALENEGKSDEMLSRKYHDKFQNHRQKWMRNFKEELKVIRAQEAYEAEMSQRAQEFNEVMAEKNLQLRNDRAADLKSRTDFVKNKMGSLYQNHKGKYRERHQDYVSQRKVHRLEYLQRKKEIRGYKRLMKRRKIRLDSKDSLVKSEE